MKKFQVTKRVDAYSNYVGVIEARSVDEAVKKARSNGDTTVYSHDGWSEFDDFDIFPEEVVLLEDDGIDDDAMGDGIEAIIRVELSGPERDVTLAALRMWQHSPEHARVPYADISHNGHSTCLPDDEIDNLCERINI